MWEYCGCPRLETNVAVGTWGWEMGRYSHVCVPLPRRARDGSASKEPITLIVRGAQQNWSSTLDYGAPHILYRDGGHVVGPFPILAKTEKERKVRLTTLARSPSSCLMTAAKLRLVWSRKYQHRCIDCLSQPVFSLSWGAETSRWSCQR